MNESDFNTLYYAKRSTELLIERVFKPLKYPSFHEYLDTVHEAWINSVGVKK